MFGIKFSFDTGLGRERSKFEKWLDKSAKAEDFWSM
jgi:hypothetical protein